MSNRYFITVNANQWDDKTVGFRWDTKTNIVYIRSLLSYKDQPSNEAPAVLPDAAIKFDNEGNPVWAACVKLKEVSDSVYYKALPELTAAENIARFGLATIRYFIAKNANQWPGNDTVGMALDTINNLYSVRSVRAETSWCPNTSISIGFDKEGNARVTPEKPLVEVSKDIYYKAIAGLSAEENIKRFGETKPMDKPDLPVKPEDSELIKILDRDIEAYKKESKEFTDRFTKTSNNKWKWLAVRVDEKITALLLVREKQLKYIRDTLEKHEGVREALREKVNNLDKHVKEFIQESKDKEEEAFSFTLD